MFRARTRVLISLSLTISYVLLFQIGRLALALQTNSDALAGKWENKWRQFFQLFYFGRNGTFDEVIGASSGGTDQVIVCSGTYTSQGSRVSLTIQKERTLRGSPTARTCAEVESFAYHFDGPDRLLLEGPIGAVALSRCSGLPGPAGNLGDRPRSQEVPRSDLTDLANKNFWGNCGAVLGEPSVTDDDLQKRIRAIMRSELEDKKVVEVEVTEAALDRINRWARMLTFFAGIPIAFLLGVLGVLGFKKYSDLWQLVSDAEDKIKPTIDHAEKTANDVEQKTNELNRRAGEMQGQVTRAEKTAGDLERATNELRKRNEEMGRLFDKLEPRLKESERLAKAYEERLTEVQRAVDGRVTGLERDVNEIKDTLMPGRVRWPVKTGSDDDAHRVASKPVVASVEQLASLVPPENVRDPKLQNSRVEAELKIYTVEATIISTKLQRSGDYTLVLQGESGATMRAQAPNPDPSFVPSSSRWAKEIGIVRTQIDAKVVTGSSVTRTRLKARITGIGFFQEMHGQIGVACNGFELHPVVQIEFLD
jgi:hypothetical protein